MACLSAYDDQFFKQIALESGMQDYYLKPISLLQAQKILEKADIQI